MNIDNGRSGIFSHPPDSHERRLQEQQRMRLLRICLGVTLVGFLIFVIVDSMTSHKIKAESVHFLEWVEVNPWMGVFAIILVYTIATRSILTVGTGFAFGVAMNSTGKGVLLATTAVFFGAFSGSICSFLLGRYLFRDCVMRLASSYPVFQAVDRALEGNGLKIMILLRLSPLIPYNALDYMSGITSVSLWSYSLALVAILPGVILFTFIGASASSLAASGEEAEKNETARIFTTIFGVAFAIIGVAVASYYSKVELDKILAEGDDQSSSSPLTLCTDQDQGGRHSGQQEQVLEHV